jgi:hypothetical protein
VFGNNPVTFAEVVAEVPVGGVAAVGGVLVVDIKYSYPLAGTGFAAVHVIVAVLGVIAVNVIAVGT